MKAHLTPRSLFTGALALGALAAAGMAQAKTLDVPAQYATIQAAISAANTGDVVVVARGLYYGSGNINIDTLGKAVTIKSAAGPGATFLDGGQYSQLFTIHSGEGAKTVISGFTIQHGYAAGSGNLTGSVQVVNSSPTITNCVFQYNQTSGYGGGLAVQNGSPNITDCTFYQNSGGYGSGLFLYLSKAIVSNCTFEDNNGYAGGGLAIDNADPNVSGCTFTNNTASYGGGAFLYSDASKLSNCTFDNNTATAVGGGVEIEAGSTAKILNASISNNTAPQGGAVRIDSSSPSLTGCGFYANSASSTVALTGGGAVYVSVTNGATAAPVVTSCLFMLNTGYYGGAVLSSGNTTVNSCVFTNNTGTQDGGAYDGLGGSSVLVNCIFLVNIAQNYNGGALRFHDGASCAITNDTFYGNHSGTNGSGDAICATNIKTITLSNSIVWDSNDPHGPGSDISWDGSGSFKIDHSDDYDGLPSGTGNLSEDPLYVNAQGGDLYLQFNSPCNRAGSPSAPHFQKTNIDGVKRNAKTPNMGAY